MRVLDSLLGRSRHKSRTLFHTPLEVEFLEARVTPDATPTLVGNTLTILGGPNADYIYVNRDVATDQLFVQDGAREVFRVDFISGLNKETALALLKTYSQKLDAV